jgi:hypothetical protein
MRITVFAHNGGHCIGNAIKSMQSSWIIQDASPIIVDDPLTLNFSEVVAILFPLFLQRKTAIMISM